MKLIRKEMEKKMHYEYLLNAGEEKISGSYPKYQIGWMDDDWMYYLNNVRRIPIYSDKQTGICLRKPLQQINLDEERSAGFELRFLSRTKNCFLSNDNGGGGEEHKGKSNQTKSIDFCCRIG